MSDPTERRTRVTVVNPKGIHGRPAGMLVRMLMSNFDPQATQILIRAGDAIQLGGKTILEDERNWREVSAFSMLDVMMLVLCEGSVAEVVCRGERSEEAVEAIEKLFASGFGEIEESEY